LAGIFSGLFCGIYFGWGKEFSSALWSGIAAGIIFGLVAAIVARYRENRVWESGPVLIDEVLLREARAAHEGMSGRLYLTDRRLLFEGYPTDETSPEVATLFEGRATEESLHHVSIPILRISEVIVSQKLGVDSRIDITMTEGRIESFATEDPADQTTSRLPDKST
jgi:hypothetical protein